MTTLNLQVSASADDAAASSLAEGKGPTGSTVTTITNTLASLGNHDTSSTASEIGGFRFQVNVAQGTTITSATFILKAQATYNSGANPIRLIVSCQAADNASAFTTAAGNLNGTNRPRTTAASGVWNIDSVTAETDYSIDVTSAVQEVISRAGFAANNYIAVMVDVDTTSYNGAEWQDFYTYDNTPSKAAKLDIDYTAGGTAYNETAGVIEAWTASAADTRAGVDTSAAILGLVAASSDTRAAVDTGAATLGLTASAADTFSQSDTTAALLGWVASSGDTGAGTDTTTAALGWLAAGADTFAQTDTTEAILGWVASGADTFDGGATAYNETAEALLGWDAGAADTFSHSDTAAAELDFIAAAGETYAGFDTASPVIEWTVSASDSTASIDSVMALLGWTASVSDSTVSPDPSRIVVDVFQAGRQVAQANKAVGQKIRKVSG